MDPAAKDATAIKIAAAQLDNQNVMMLEDSQDVNVREPATYWFYQVPKGYDDAGAEMGPLGMSSLEKAYRDGKIDGAIGHRQRASVLATQ